MCLHLHKVIRLAMKVDKTKSPESFEFFRSIRSSVALSWITTSADDHWSLAIWGLIDAFLLILNFQLVPIFRFFFKEKI